MLKVVTTPPFRLDSVKRCTQTPACFDTFLEAGTTTAGDRI
jgi:hypothetical protein